MESIPQLATQWCAVATEAWRSYYAHDGKKNFITPLQAISIATSTITIVRSIISFIDQKRRYIWISPQYPALASHGPLLLFLLTGLTAATTQIRFLYDKYVLFHVLNGSSALFAILVVVTPKTRPTCCWRIIRSCIHSSLMSLALCKSPKAIYL